VVQGLSLTPTSLGIVLVEGDQADGVVLDHVIVDATAIEDRASSRNADPVVAAVQRMRASAAADGHRLLATGLTGGDYPAAGALRDELVGGHTDDEVVLVSQVHAANVLAWAVGRAMGCATTALMSIDSETATVSVVDTAAGRTVYVLGRSMHSPNATAVLTEMVTALDEQQPRPDALFVVGSGVDIAAMTSHLRYAARIPVSAPEKPELALARGAALSAIGATCPDLGYSQQPQHQTTADVASAPALCGDPGQLVTAASGPA